MWKRDEVIVQFYVISGRCRGESGLWKRDDEKVTVFVLCFGDMTVG